MGQKRLPVICARCGSEAVYRDQNSARAIIRCKACGRRIYAYYNQQPSKSIHQPAAESAALPSLEGYTNITRTLYQYLQRYIDTYGYAPTLRECQRGLGWGSVSSVRYHLGLLEEGGLIERDYATSRGIRLTP